MARQRFIHPEIWKDPVFGRLQPLEQMLFIGLFSLADDEGRINADPAYLRSELFAYKDYTAKKVKTLRDGLAGKVKGIRLYHVDGVDYIALLKWSEYQKPKYPKPSKLPEPPNEARNAVEEAFGKDGGSLPESGATGWAGFGVGSGLGSNRAGFGLGREDEPQTSAGEPVDQELIEGKVDDMLECANDSVDGSKSRLLTYALMAPESSLAKVLESCQSRRKAIGVGYIVNALKSELEEHGIEVAA
jgi:hypothetical protein